MDTKEKLRRERPKNMVIKGTRETQELTAGGWFKEAFLTAATNFSPRYYDGITLKRREILACRSLVIHRRYPTPVQRFIRRYRQLLFHLLQNPVACVPSLLSFALFALSRAISHSLSPFPFFLFLRSALILALHGKKSVASCSRLRGSGRNYTEARTATDQHDRRPNYYYGKNRAGSCVLIFRKNLGAKRETRNCANKCRIPRWSLVSATMARTCKVIEHEDRPTEVPPIQEKRP